MALSPGTRIGPYEIVSPLGAGGMGEVYRAHDARLRRDVAVKVLPAELSTDAGRVARFEREARAASALNHPNIVTVHEIGADGPVVFLAMELVEGRTLRDLLASGPLAARRILGIGAQIAEGLAKAHGAGIVHRDLKPENVMVSADGFVKILDFGLAKLAETESGGASAMLTMTAESPRTQSGTILGTVSYMSPEQASGEPLDFRSDQFSLGSILYELAVGERAFARKTAAETMAAIIREEPEPIARRRPETPPPLRWIVERCLAKDPDERYASTRDLARDLAGVRDRISEASSGIAEMPAASGPRPRRRPPLLVGFAGLAAGLLAGWALTRGLSKAPPSAPAFHRLTFRRGLIANARFAPDGKTVLYGANWEGAGGDVQLYSVSPESPEARRFDLPSGDILAVSAAGELAINFKPVRSLMGWTKGTLARLPMAGGVPRQVLEGVRYASADWSRDGKELAVVREVDGAGRMEFPIGKKIVEESDDPCCLRFSPRGDEIAFFAGSVSGVAIVDSLGKSRKILSKGWQDLSGAPCWRPDGQEIWFSAAEAGNPDAFWAVDRRGRSRLVTRVPGSLELDDISHDGRVLAAHHTNLVSVRGLAPGESQERELSWLDAAAVNDLSPDGKLLLMTETGEGAAGSPKTYLRGMDGSPAVLLGDGQALALSPDGKWVLAAGGEDGSTPSLKLMPTGPGETRTLKTTGIDAIGPGVFLPDSKGIVFLAEQRGRAGVWTEDIPDGTPHLAVRETGEMQLVRSVPAVSPDGRFVIGRRAGKPVLCPLDGGEPRPIEGLEEQDIPLNWTLNGRSVYALNPKDRTVRLIDLDTGQRRVWKQFGLEPGAANMRVRITPDGKAYAYSFGRVYSELYVIDGLR